MPKAQPPIDPLPACPLDDDEAVFIKEAVRQIYGRDAIVRNFGPNPERLDLHVEFSQERRGLERDDCLGLLMCRVDRPINLVETRRGDRVHGGAKIAYRQGVVI